MIDCTRFAENYNFNIFFTFWEHPPNSTLIKGERGENISLEIPPSFVEKATIYIVS